MATPKYDEMYDAVLKALRALGGSATISEIEDKVAEVMNLSDTDVEAMYREDRNLTHYRYRLGWTRNYLKRFGVIDNSERGIWTLTELGKKTERVDRDEVNRFVKGDAKGRAKPSVERSEPEAEEGWEDRLIAEVLRLKPSAFERLCQRVLRESGFVEVEVTGKSGDGGIDGHGIMRVSGLISFQVVFQCKRYSGNVSPNQVREFRGAMSGRTDKGIIITTGGFTREAKSEARRAGVPRIDLISGRELAQKMKDLGLGLSVAMKEEVTVNPAWFANV